MTGIFTQSSLINVLRFEMSRMMSELDAYVKEGIINPKLQRIIEEFYENYRQAIVRIPHYKEKGLQQFDKLLELVIENIRHPYSFSIFHRTIRHPFDYYQFGLDFMRPFIRFEDSKILGLEFLRQIQDQLKKGENVILLANHQTEPDPQIMSLLLEKMDPSLAENMVFIAGHRVISDPMAIPMSLGRNLLCIYSKKYVSHPPEEKQKKILHNQRTLKKMQELLNEGGYCIYVAPSGGRDRPNALGEIELAPFDAQSIEFFWLMGQQAAKPTHFYPLALQTYHLMPPPHQIENELGEKRVINITPVYLAFGQEIDMDTFPGSQEEDKKAKRNQRADHIWSQVFRLYQDFPK